MGDRIEKLYLLGKVNEVINEVVETEKHFFTKVNSLPSKFDKLKIILEKELENSTITASSSSPTSKLTKEKLYIINNLLCEWQSKQNSPLSLDSQLFFYTCAVDLDKILEELPAEETIYHQAETITEAYRWSNQFVVEKSISGIADTEVSLRRLILAQPPEEDGTAFRTFGLVGMRGIGKTVLAQMVFNHPDVRSHFLLRVWVCVSKQPDDDLDPKKEIVMRILRSLGLEEEIIRYAMDNHQLKGLLYSLRQQLSGKRYLIVLDDVYVEDKEYLKFVSSLEKNIENCEETLAYGLPKECGGAIIVTSRSKDIAGRLVGEENLHKVLPLSDDNCWEIFKNNYKEKEEDVLSSDMVSLKKKITEKCHGLPLAAKMMGEIARKAKKSPKTS